MYLLPDYSVDLHLERIDCAFNRWGYNILPQYFRGHQASRDDLRDEDISLLAGRTSHGSMAASQLLHLYHTLAWRTCCL